MSEFRQSVWADSDEDAPLVVGNCYGQYTSGDTGLVYLRKCVYDPTTAQSLTVDRLTSLTGEPYAYAGDKPLNRIDPSGFEAIPIPIEGPDAVACLTPETVGAGVVMGGGGYIITEDVKSLVNFWAGEGPVTTKVKLSSRKEKQSENNAGSQIRRPDRRPDRKFGWRGKGPVGSNEGAWCDPDNDESLYPHLGENSHGPHYDYEASSRKYRPYPDGGIEPKP